MKKKGVRKGRRFWLCIHGKESPHPLHKIWLASLGFTLTVPIGAVRGLTASGRENPPGS